MNRRTSIKKGGLLILGASTGFTFAQEAQGTIGKLSKAEFKQMNEAAAAKVKAIVPAQSPMNEADAALLKEVAAGGNMQLEVSRVAVKMANSDDVKVIAEAEVDEQTTLAAKLKQLAKASDISLSDDADDKTQEMVSSLKGMSGAEVDRTYLRECGVKGHQMLKETMERVQSKAQNATLKSLATAALPLIETHLTVARDEAVTLD